MYCEPTCIKKGNLLYCINYIYTSSKAPKLLQLTTDRPQDHPHEEHNQITKRMNLCYMALTEGMGCTHFYICVRHLWGLGSLKLLWPLGQAGRSNWPLEPTRPR